MKGISYSRFGGSDVLEYGDLPEPKLSQNTVIVRMKGRGHQPGRHPRCRLVWARA